MNKKRIYNSKEVKVQSKEKTENASQSHSQNDNENDNGSDNKNIFPADCNQQEIPNNLTFINEFEFCEIIGKRPSTVRAYRTEGKGCNYYKMEGTIRYRLSDVMEYIKGCKNNPAAKKFGSFEKQAGKVANIISNLCQESPLYKTALSDLIGLDPNITWDENNLKKAIIGQLEGQQDIKHLEEFLSTIDIKLKDKVPDSKIGYLLKIYKSKKFCTAKPNKSKIYR